MLYLLTVISQQSRSKRYTVEAIPFQFFVQVFFREILITNQFAERRHHIVESQLVVIFYTGRNFSRPSGNERHTDTTFQTLAFQAPKFTVTSEKFWVCTSFFMRAVVTTENYQCIFVQSFFFQLGQNLAYVTVQTGNHGCKFGMCMHRRIVTRTLTSSPSLILKELLFVMLQDRVIRLSQFRMRQRICKETIERLLAILAVQPF